ncbi:MAG: hypothetical protein GY748_00595 [Planctomycetaceae bacterium]|nr:hypothetical protein [Planctomycetaceae bacterium]
MRQFMVGMSRLVGFVFSSVVFGLICVLAGCGVEPTTSQDLAQDSNPVGDDLVVRAPPKPVQLSERDCEVIHFVLSTETVPNGGKPLYLTPTNRDQWNREGDWASMPSQLEPWLAQLAVKYRSAADAKLDKGYVRDKATNARGTMVWIIIREWTAANEVTLDFGLWGGPLDASGKTITCLKKDGQWQVKEITDVWLS